jgi:hypothetical protein
MNKMMNKIEKDPEKYARESFSFRNMTKWQLWSITIVAVALLIAVAVYVSG